MKQRERVVVFDGEEQFIAQKNRIFDKKKGTAKTDKEIFDEYMRTKDAVAEIPAAGVPDFCVKLQEFIETRGDGKASPMQLQEAINRFRMSCIEKPAETSEPVDTNIPSQPLSTTTTTTTTTPAPQTKTSDTGNSSPSTTTGGSGSTTSTTPSVPSGGISLSTPSLGKPPAGGGGGKEEAAAPKKKNYLWLLLILGGVAVYYMTKKKN